MELHSLQDDELFERARPPSDAFFAMCIPEARCCDQRTRAGTSSLHMEDGAKSDNEDAGEHPLPFEEPRKKKPVQHRREEEVASQLQTTEPDNSEQNMMIRQAQAKEESVHRFREAGLEPRKRSANIDAWVTNGEQILKSYGHQPRSFQWWQWHAAVVVEGKAGQWFFSVLVMINGILIGVEVSE